MAQVARNLMDAVAGPLRGFGHLIVDRDPLFTAQFESLLASACVELLRLPARSPNLNAYAERFVRSIEQECLRHIIPLGERHLRTAVAEFMEHYHAERNHQGLGNVIPFPSNASPAVGGPICRRERLGGLLKFYCERSREAADRIAGHNGVRRKVSRSPCSAVCITTIAWRREEDG
jgi:putative transposase